MRKANTVGFLKKSKVVLFIIFHFSFLIFYYTGSCQEAKSMKITDVVGYIKKSDHPLVVAFWATWCGPCVEEIPWLQEAVKKHADHKVELLLVSLDFPKDYPSKVNEFLKSRKFDATIFWLNETRAD